MLLRDFDEDRIDVQVTIEDHAQVYDFKDQEFGYDIVYACKLIVITVNAFSPLYSDLAKILK